MFRVIKKVVKNGNSLAINISSADRQTPWLRDLQKGEYVEITIKRVK